MKITAAMTAEADAAAQRYELLISGWRSLFTASLNSTHFGTPKVKRDLVSQAYGMARIYLEAERALIETASQRVIDAASLATLAQINSANDTKALTGELLSDNSDYLIHEISVQIERDIAMLAQSIQRTAISVNLIARSQQLPLQAALIQYQTGSSTDLRFYFRDRGSQRWPSRKFIRVVWRQHLLSLYNETVLTILADHGLSEAQVVHVDPHAESHGMLVTLQPGSKIPTYDDIRTTIFHPNADAVLAMAS